MATSYTSEILVLSTITTVTRPRSVTSMELLNLGPNAIWVAIGDSTACVINKCRQVGSGEAWAFEAASNATVYAICSVSQVTGAATILTEGIR